MGKKTKNKGQQKPQDPTILSENTQQDKPKPSKAEKSKPKSEIFQSTEKLQESPTKSTDSKKHKLTEEEFILQEHLEEESLTSTLQFFIRHSIRDIGRRKFHYSLAFCSVFIVVLSTLVINTVVEKGPIIFLRLAEQNHGEIDGFLMPYGEYKFQAGNNHIFLNYSRVTELYGTTYNLAPRKYINSMVMTMDFNSELYYDSAQRKEWEQTFDKRLKLPTREDTYRIKEKHPFVSKILAIKTLRERDIDLGRDYKYRPMELGECYMTREQGDRFTKFAELAFIKIPVTHLLSQLIDKYNKAHDSHLIFHHDFLEARMPCKLSYIEKDAGKNSPHWGYATYMEFDRLLELISYYLPEPYNTTEYAEFREYLKTPNLLDEFSDAFIVTLPKPRIEIFESPDIQTIRGKMAAYFSKIEEALGFFPVYLRSELLYDLANYSKFVLFIGLIFDLVVVLLVIISVLLIYSLLMINIETKSFEIGVQRMIGLSKSGLVAIVLVQSFLFVIPAIMAGFICSVPCLMIFSEVLMALLRIDVRSTPCDTAVLQALVVGLLIPSFSAAIPINAALAKNLNDALDFQRSKNQAVYMEVLQKGRRNVGGLLTFGIFASTYGISVYYLLPYALLSFNLTLILRMFVFILFGMLFAMTLIALNTQRIFEIAFTYVFLFFEQASIKTLVLKNLMANRSRNKLTTIIYSLGLGFIIFLNVAYKVQLETLQLHDLRFRAGYLQLQIDHPDHVMNPRLIEPVLKKYKHMIESFSWIPMELDKIRELRIKATTVSDFQELEQAVQVSMVSNLISLKPLNKNFQMLTNLIRQAD